MSKIAVVHDYFTQFGGAERVAITLAQELDAPLYTSVFQPEGTYAELRSMDVHTTRLQQLLERVPGKNFKLLAPLYPRAFRSIDLNAYDTVIVSTSGYAHHVRHPNALIYCHTPPHFIYELDRYTNRRLVRVATSPFLRGMQSSDRKAASKHQYYAANSRAISRRIAEVYGKTAPVIYPPLTTDHLPLRVSPLPEQPRALIVGRLLPYKRFDIAIEACKQLNLPLTVVGTGPDEPRLRNLAGTTVTFTGRLADEALREAFHSHSVILAPGIEDFGFGPIEANYAGRPVVAAAAGGALETVIDGVTGALVESASPEVWAKTIGTVLERPWNPQELRESTERFSRATFIHNIRAWIAGDLSSSSAA